jgi:hypothetical protein
MRREQARMVVLIVVAVHALPAVALTWLLLQSDGGSPPSSHSPSPRKPEGAASLPKMGPPKPAPPPQEAAPKTAPVKKEQVILRETVVLPTLDTPIPAGKSAVWCASFQMAWDRLREDFVREPIRLKGADEAVDRLNRSPFPVAAIASSNVYAVAGRYEDGILKKVREEMARRFPAAKLPLLEGPKEGVLAFAYLQSKVPFPVPYGNHPGGIEFRDSSGHSRRVAGFGFRALRRSDQAWETLEQFEKQLKILHVEVNDKEQPKTFVIDPCQGGSPDQIVLARMERKSTLGTTVASVEKAIESFPRESEYRVFIPGDQVWMPALSLDLEHRFRELEGRQFVNERERGHFLTTAIQTVRFKFDANGAELDSVGLLRKAKSDDRSPQNLTFDRPFLLYVKKRGGKQPFLVMWIDNSGLMQPKDLPPPVDD